MRCAEVWRREMERGYASPAKNYHWNWGSVCDRGERLIIGEVEMEGQDMSIAVESQRGLLNFLELAQEPHRLPWWGTTR